MKNNGIDQYETKAEAQQAKKKFQIRGRVQWCMDGYGVKKNDGTWLTIENK